MLENLDDSQYTDESWKDLETTEKRQSSMEQMNTSSQKELDQTLDALLRRRSEIWNMQYRKYIWKLQCRRQSSFLPKQ